MKKQAKINAARIQRAITGKLIPMMEIPKLYKAMEAKIAEGATDDELAAFVTKFLAGD